MNDRASRWRRISAFCLFVGYGRSGHSAVGSVIDAHPQAVVAHELNAVRRYFEGVERDVLFDEIFALSQAQARAGRQSPRAEGGNYPQGLDGQVKPYPGGITVIGDKKGAGTARQFARHGLHRIDDFKSYIGVPVKVLHVVRNPFDIVAAGMAAGRSGFAEIVAIVADIRQRCLGDDWLDVYHERLIAEPREEVARIATFLGLPVLPQHLDDAVAHVYTQPHRRRFETDWPDGARAMVEKIIARHDYFGGYTWHR